MNTHDIDPMFMSAEDEERFRRELEAKFIEDWLRLSCEIQLQTEGDQ